MAQPLGPLSIAIDQKPNFDSLNHYLIVHADTPSAIDDYQYMVPLSKVYNRVVVTLTSAQILTSNTTPVELIPAPGAGKFIMPTSVVYQVISGTTDYATNTSATVTYSGLGTTFSNVTLNNLGAVNSVNWLTAFTGNLFANNSLVFRTATGNPTNGNKALKFIVEYKVIDFNETV